MKHLVTVIVWVSIGFSLYLNPMELAKSTKANQASEALNYQLCNKILTLVFFINGPQYDTAVIEIKQLINQGASINYSGGGSSLVAQLLSDPDLLRFALEHGAHTHLAIMPKRNTVLHTALIEFFSADFNKRAILVKSINLLLKNGADLDQQNSDSDTPLLAGLRMALALSRIDLIPALLEVVPLFIPKKFYLKKLKNFSYVKTLPGDLINLIPSDANLRIKNKDGKSTIDLLHEILMQYSTNPYHTHLEELLKIVEQ
jgi:ankyrin repeat protein